MTLLPAWRERLETLFKLVHRDLPPEAAGRHGQGWDYTLPQLAEVAAESG